MAGSLCGKWMPRAGVKCARGDLHGGACKTPEAMERMRERTAVRGAPQDPADRTRWNLTYRLSRYGLTQKQFARLLEAQGYACAMGRKPFEAGQPIFIDHDHECCPDEKSSCGKCVRGLLELSCNTSLGHIERKLEMARAYLASPPAQLVVRVEQVA